MRTSEHKQNNKLKILFNRMGLPGKSTGDALLLEYLDSGPTAHIAIRLVKCNHFGQSEPEIHLEYRNGLWLPFYFFNEVSGNEVHLYRMEGEDLVVDYEAGSWLIGVTGVFELNPLRMVFLKN
ncbi:MAG: hypothetical protein HS115_06135 [Spirochaetales bacterium]|nr:hypothetical protein [Spirochaetales bacterium]